MTNPLLERAAKHNAQARAIKDEFEGKDMPAEAFRQMQAHAQKATEYRAQFETEQRLVDNESWLNEPVYKHDMTAQTGGTSAGEFLLESEKKDRAKGAFFDYLRKGHGQLGAEQKAALVEDATGQIIVPRDIVGIILDKLPQTSVFRRIAWVRPTTSNKVDVAAINIAAPSWGKLELGDTAADGLGNPPVSGPDTITVHDLNALVRLGVDELADTDQNIEAIIQSQLSSKFAQAEDAAFAAGTGDGSKQPVGVATSADVTQKVTAATIGAVVSDDIIKLYYAVANDTYRESGEYVGTAAMEQAVRLLKNGNGDYIWQERFREGLPPLLNGRPWYTVSGLPNPAATGAGSPNKALFYGDFSEGYMIADRQQLVTQRLNELFAAEGKVGILFRHRVGGDVIRPNALAYLEV